jgi:hypothetical protein
LYGSGVVLYVATLDTGSDPVCWQSEFRILWGQEPEIF